MMRDYYLDGEKIEAAIPWDEVRRRKNAESLLAAKGKESEVKSHIGIVERRSPWTPPVVAAGVRAVAADERVCFGEQYERMEVDPSPAAETGPKRPKVKEPVAQLSAEKKKAGKITRRALGANMALSLTLKELATISPLMAEQLIGSIKEAAGPSLKEKAEKLTAAVGTATVEVRSAEWGERPTNESSVSILSVGVR
jgi:hypothetical protein